MGAYGSPELPIASSEGSPPARPRQRSTAVGARVWRTLRRTVVVILCVIGALAVLGGLLSLTVPSPVSNTAVVGR